MLINFTDLITRHGIKPKGILHIGASTGQEAAEYDKNGIVHQLWIEALPEVFKTLKQNLSHNPHAIAVNACISDTDGLAVEMGFTPINNGESSSFLPFGTHLKHHPEVQMTEKIKMTTTTVDTIFELNKLITSPDKYSFLNIDLQGAELLALKGAEKTLQHISAIYAEVNGENVYDGCCLLPDFDRYLSDRGFERVELKWAIDNVWGDAFYVRKS